MADGSDGWSVLQAATRFATPYLQVVEERVASPGRPQGRDWVTVHRRKAAVVAPFTPVGELLLVRQERVSIREEIWEFPAGQVDDAEPHTLAGFEATGLRELREEAGVQPADGKLMYLGPFYASAGFTDECMHLFAARDVQATADGHNHDDSEVITMVRAFKPAELWDAIAQFEIRDANTLALCARLHAAGLFSR